MAKKGAHLLGTQADQFATAGKINAATTILGEVSRWDWKSNDQFKSEGYGSPPVPAFSGYTPSR